MESSPQTAVSHPTLKDRARELEQSGQLTEAKRLYEQACAQDAGDAEAWFGLGVVNEGLDDFAAAQDCLAKAIALHPEDAEAHYYLGVVYQDQGQLEEALASYREALRLQPRHAEALYNSGTVHQSKNQLKEAINCYQGALQVDPQYAKAYSRMGTVLQELQQYEPALTCHKQAIRIAPEQAAFQYALASAYYDKQDVEAAQASVEKVLALEPDSSEACALMVTIQEKKGDFDGAWKRLQPLLEAGVETTQIALAYAGLCRHIGRCTEAAALMERLLARASPPLSDYERTSLHFALGRLYDAQGNYAEAFRHYQLGNRLKDAQYDRHAHETGVDALIAAFSAEFLARAPRATVRSERPVFIVGMPRSGTTLTEQILASHPQVHGAGELDDIRELMIALPDLLDTDLPYPDCLSQLTQEVCDELAEYYLTRLQYLSGEMLRVTNKLPHNFTHLGLISLLFPGASVIHCVRDPLDTCLSCYFQHFLRSHEYCYDLENLGAHYRQYQRLMAHWKQVLDIPMLEVRYGELVEEPERISKEIVEFCGLPWNEACLQFHKTGRLVHTASHDQVRRPMYKSSSGRWRHYEAYLGPLRKALAGE